MTVGAPFVGQGGFELEIADSGPGLDEEQLKHLFEPFYTTKSSGTGLGLAIVHRIAEAHGGRAFVEPGEEGGARFVLDLPRKR